MKCVNVVAGGELVRSLSSWRAWIEIGSPWVPLDQVEGRSPHGERGLKCEDAVDLEGAAESLSSWRAWIEIEITHRKTGDGAVALLMESVD